MKMNLSLAQARSLVGKGTHATVFARAVLGAHSPVSLFLQIAHGKKCAVLFESVEGERNLSRYSFIGFDPYKVFEFRGCLGKFVFKSGRVKKEKVSDPLTLIQRELHKVLIIPQKGKEPQFLGGAVGYFGYEGVRYFENIPEIKTDSLKMPDGVYGFFDTVVIVDHSTKNISIVKLLELKGDIEKKYKRAVAEITDVAAKIQSSAPSKIGAVSLTAVREADIQSCVKSNTTKEEYLDGVRKAKEYISNGDIIQVAYAQKFSTPFHGDGFKAYQALRAINPSPYMYYLKFPQFEIAGSSPEVLARCENGEIFVTALAGTRPRGKNIREDNRLTRELLADEKENAEHVMLVDLARNDVGRVSRIGSVSVSRLKYIVKYSHVMHIASDVVGKLKSDLTPFDVFRSCFPRGTVSGAPKIRAMEIIAELEKERRGVYSGGVGYFDFKGNMNFALGIRTIIIKDRTAFVQAGAGIVYDSIPDREYQESVNKAKGPLIAAIAAKTL